MDIKQTHDKAEKRNKESNNKIHALLYKTFTDNKKEKTDNINIHH